MYKQSHDLTTALFCPLSEGPSEWWSAARVMELEAQVSTLKAELQESRDHADLLEFRILEFTEEDRVSTLYVSVYQVIRWLSGNSDNIKKIKVGQKMIMRNQ